MPYVLGQHSRSELEGVHPQLVDVVKRAIVLTKQDFTVHDGLRTPHEQAEYVRTGVSQTMRSKHLRQDDGYGHAVDLVPYINGRLRWEWPPIYDIAAAMRDAALELGVSIRWGGCWHRLDVVGLDPKQAVEDYVARMRNQGRNAFNDGPHYELL